MMSEMPHEADRPVGVEIFDDMLYVTLQDGRIITTPLVWYPRLMGASPEEQAVVELGFAGIHWPLIDEDLSVAGMLRGNRPIQTQPKVQQEV
jgi:hypothetical protein